MRVAATTRRDLAIFLSYHFSAALSFVNAWLAAVAFYFVDRFVGEPEAIEDLDGGYFEFALIGLIVAAFVGLGLTAFTELINFEQNTGTLEIVLSTPMSTPALLLGGFFSQSLMVLFEVGVMIVVGLGILGAGINWAGLAAGIPVLALTTLAFAALGIIGAALAILVKRGDPFSGPIEQAVMLLGGVIFPPEVLPAPLETLSYLVPASYATRAMRELMLADSGIAATVDEMVVLAGFTVVLMPVALWVFRAAVQRAREAGTLGTY